MQAVRVSRPTGRYRCELNLRYFRNQFIYGGFRLNRSVSPFVVQCDRVSSCFRYYSSNDERIHVPQRKPLLFWKLQFPCSTPCLSSYRPFQLQLCLRCSCRLPSILVRTSLTTHGSSKRSRRYLISHQFTAFNDHGASPGAAAAGTPSRHAGRGMSAARRCSKREIWFDGFFSIDCYVLTDEPTSRVIVDAAAAA